MNNKVFVYGTLKSGGEIRGLSGLTDPNKAQIVGIATTTYPDYDMLDLGSFPGVVMNGTKKIKGEVWEVDDETMEQLDAIEGYPDFYNRIPTETTQGKAHMYFLGPQYRKEYTGVDTSANIEDNEDTLSWKN
jgi:gamma-glutamylcyclotransferase (GGCT)/AIG2-like uncharacterized protein YtfP|tara:strand:+ start:3348 stop:3743 length:396 start_codon:yes stop_codon:yes gene_type:complete